MWQRRIAQLRSFVVRYQPLILTILDQSIDRRFLFQLMIYMIDRLTNNGVPLTLLEITLILVLRHTSTAIVKYFLISIHPIPSTKLTKVLFPSYLHF